MSAKAKKLPLTAEARSAIAAAEESGAWKAVFEHVNGYAFTAPEDVAVLDRLLRDFVDRELPRHEGREDR